VNSSSPSLSRTSNVWQSVGVVAQEVDGDLVLLNSRDGAHYGLTGISVEIWEMLITPISVERLYAKLAKRFAVDEVQCELDVMEFLNDLYRQGLICAEEVE